VIGVDDLNPYYPVTLQEARLERLRATGGPRFTFHHLDFADMPALTQALQGQEIERIVHLGAQAGVRYSLENPHAYARSNLVGHLNLLEIARQRSVAHMVYASSSSVYGGNTSLPFAVEDRVDHPVSLYAATKRADELMSESCPSLPPSADRPALLHRLRSVGAAGHDAVEVHRCDLGRRACARVQWREMWRDFTHIDDILDGVIACVDRPPAVDGEAKAGGSHSCHALYNIGNNRPEKLTKVIALLEQACGRRARVELLPMQPGDVERTFADIGAIARDHGFAPRVAIEDGVPQFVRWFREWRGV